MTETLAAGWYPDPADNTKMRYWDGQQWAGAGIPTSAMPGGTAGSPIQGQPAEKKNVWPRIVVRVMLVLSLFGVGFFVLLVNTIGTSKSSDVPLTIAAAFVVLPLVIAGIVKTTAD
ncbi:DUF2510 domain-containing protein [Rhodococcus aetherivorans]|uniref:DUF2510 domain-containing protein n=1 Tax=Rhodococcus aetherivorans TaxID=191292 RepID=UPI002949DBF3|nr:DUF2510 domain-containing protein [Rhodococcus aetherivorans]MDV6296550.1 DUF2510 domain-containing protein [Rhodococcus aetherivorans]